MKIMTGNLSTELKGKSDIELNIKQRKKKNKNKSFLKYL
jgi:hypothetical protein